MAAMPVRRKINHKALIRAREKAGDGSKNSAAAAAGLTFQGYNNWEKGVVGARFDWNCFTALCAYLQVNPEDITELVEESDDQLVLQVMTTPSTLSKMRRQLSALGHDLAHTRMLSLLQGLIARGVVTCEGRGRKALYSQVSVEVQA